jgi:tripartite-type tricarboxylate transporter receptor subunit TctC
MTRTAFLVTLAIAAVAGSGDAVAQSSYPDRSIRLVSINASGAPGDILARLIGDKLSASFSKPIVVENMPGAGGSIAAAHVTKAAPDGYTLLLSGDAPLVTNVSLYDKLAYDPVNDLAPISQLIATPNVLVVPVDLPVKSVAELTALGRSKSANFTFGHGGLGFSTHLSGELFKTLAQIDLQQVMFRQSVYPDLIAGRITMCFCNIAQALPLARENKLRALAVTSLKRSPAAPDLPTLDEWGFPGFDVTSWFALMAPAGTPQPIINKLHDEVVRILALPDVRQKLSELGMEIVGSSPTELAALIRTQTPQRASLIKASGVKMQ